MDSKLEEIYRKSLAETKKRIKESVGKDTLLVQSINSIDETNKVANILAKRLREWYELYNPEFSRSIASHEKFVELILTKGRKELLSEINLVESDSMGADIEKEDIESIMDLARSIKNLYEAKAIQEKYIEKSVKQICPNMNTITGHMIAAKLVALAGTLKKLSRMPSSTIQLLGAEKALFRHLKTGAKPPKYGILHEHPLLLQAKKSDHGKIARMLADKISIAVKVDFFKGEFVGDKLIQEINKRIK
jgi:nucleolar protein 56